MATARKTATAKATAKAKTKAQAKTTRAPKKSGPKPCEFDLAKVERLAGLGLTQEKIALALGCSKRTVSNRLSDNAEFAQAYMRGRASREVIVADKLADRCDEGDVSAIKFYLQCVAGWREKQDITVQAEVKQETTVSLKDMSTEELQAALAKLMK